MRKLWLHSGRLRNYLAELFGSTRVSSRVFSAQYLETDWHQRLSGGAHADAIMDRSAHSALWVETGARTGHRTVGSPLAKVRAMSFRRVALTSASG